MNRNNENAGLNYVRDRHSYGPRELTRAQDRDDIMWEIREKGATWNSNVPNYKNRPTQTNIDNQRKVENQLLQDVQDTNSISFLKNSNQTRCSFCNVKLKNPNMIEVKYHQNSEIFSIKIPARVCPTCQKVFLAKSKTIGAIKEQMLNHKN